MDREDVPAAEWLAAAFAFLSADQWFETSRSTLETRENDQ
jgi:hypothetical protein